MPVTLAFTIFTDGACLGNPGPGGYAAILRRGTQEREFSGGFRRTTNNRMELMAAIVALENTPAGSQATLYSDSNYLVQAVTLGWARGWKARGWKRTGKEKALNPDLWERLLKLLDQRDVAFVWVRGHAGHPENERCDRVSVAAAQRPNLPPDAGFESEVSAKPKQSGLF
jgi:ribonuclease HI